MYERPLPVLVTWSAWVPRAACCVSMTGASPFTRQVVVSSTPLSKSSHSSRCAAPQRLCPKKAARFGERSRPFEPPPPERQAASSAAAAHTKAATARTCPITLLEPDLDLVAAVLGLL